MYLPLQFAENFKLPYESPNQLVRMLSALISEGRSDEVLMFMRSKWFMDPDADCPERHKPFQEFCLHYRKYILSDLGHFPEDLIQAFWEDTKKRRDSVSDIISPYLILDEWSRSKQVYCFDPEMEIALADTDEVAVGPGVMDRLPYKVFYIEFHRDGTSFTCGGMGVVPRSISFGIACLTGRTITLSFPGSAIIAFCTSGLGFFITISRLSIPLGSFSFPGSLPAIARFLAFPFIRKDIASYRAVPIVFFLGIFLIRLGIGMRVFPFVIHVRELDPGGFHQVRERLVITIRPERIQDQWVKGLHDPFSEHHPFCARL